MSGTILYYQCKSCLTYIPPTSKWDRHLGKCLASNMNPQLGSIPKPVGFRLVKFREAKVIIKRADNNAKLMKTSDWSDSKCTNVQRRQCHDNTKVFRKSYLVANQRVANICSNILNKSQEKFDSKKLSSSIKTTRKHVKKDDSPLKVRKYSFSCNLCPAKFHTSSDLEMHHGVHNGSRRLMTCCICGRVFNKRDSLNAHYLAHEAAEAREEKFKLLEPWNPDFIRQSKGVKKLSNFGPQQICRFCLLSHSTYHSYITHIREEHTENPEAHQFPCKFDNCAEKFGSIRVLLEHAKSTHPKEFWGRLTWHRMTKGIFTGKLVRQVDEQGKQRNKRVFELKTKKSGKSNTGTETNLKHTKRVRRFTPASKRPLSGNVEDDWERKNRNSVRHIKRYSKPNGISTLRDCIPQEKKIELESVDICSDDNEKHHSEMFCNSFTAVKKELSGTLFKPELEPDIDLVKGEIDINNDDHLILLQNSTEVELGDIINEAKPSKKVNTSGCEKDTESEPHLFGIIKGEVLCD